MIVRPLGRGGMGEVYIARTPWPDRPLAAVKRLRPDVARISTFAERFKHEAELAVRLHHENIVATIDVGKVNEQLYVASELVLGKDTGVTADRLRERGLGAPQAVVIRLLLDVLEGLAYVHGAREPDGRPLSLVHRDVTPGNVLVGYDGVARLADFGLAKSHLTEKSNLTGHGEILGTPHYLAPELIRGEKATPASDVYGLGAVMYRVLTGVAPHQGTTAEVLFKALSEKPRRLSELRPDLPDWFVSFIHRMLEGDLKRRPFDAALLKTQLEREATKAKLLLPHTSVGRWLAQLFEAEQREEMAEREELIAIDPKLQPAAAEGTVVLARHRSGSRLAAPPIRVDELGSDSQGTEMELAAVRPSSLSAAEVAALPTRALFFDSDVGEPIGMGDAASLRRRDGEEGTVEAVESLKLREDSDAALSTGPDPGLDDYPKGKLPGFVDVPGEQNVFEKTNPQADEIESSTGEEALTAIAELKRESFDKLPRSSPPPPARQRPKNPDSVVVQAARRVVEKTATVPDRGERPAVSLAPPSESDLHRKAEKRSYRSNRFLVPLAVSTMIAMTTGVFLGGWISSLRGAQVSSDDGEKALNERLVRVRVRLAERKAAGEPIPDAVWETFGDATQSLIGGRLSDALRFIEELEVFLKSTIAPPSTASSHDHPH